MQLEDYFDFFSPEDIRVRGTRIGIETILYDTIHRSRTPEQIVASYRSLNLEQVYATLTYYQRNKAEVDRYLTEWLEWSHQTQQAQLADPKVQDWLARMRRARDERRQAEAALPVGKSA